MPEFESFRRTMSALKAEPHITIQKRGVISLNRAAYVAVAEPDAVELLYDRFRGILGLRPADTSDEHAYYVRRVSDSQNGPWVVSCMAFTKYYEIDTTESRRWPAYVDDCVLCADIHGEGVPVTSNRSGSSEHRPRMSAD